MATFVARSGPGGRRVWQVKIRRNGWPMQSATFDSKGAADVWARQVEGEMDRGVFVSRAEAEGTSLADALKRYAVEVSSKKRSALRERYTIDLWQRSALGRRSLASLRGKDIAMVVRDLEASGLGANTVRIHLALLSHLFTIARKEWGLESLSNPVALIRKPRLPEGRTRRLIEGEEQRLLAAAEIYGGEIAHIIRWAIATAMRRSEIAAMRWEHLDKRRSVLHIPQTKNGSPRTIPLSTQALTALGRAEPKGAGLVWSLRPDSITQAFERVCGASGIDGMTFHDLRHEAASRLFERGLNPMEVAAVTGHKTLQMLKRYTHLRAEDLVGKMG